MKGGGIPGVPPMEVVFTGVASINLVAYSTGSLLKPGDRIVCRTEHHSTSCPGSSCVASGIEIDVVPVTVTGRIDLNALHLLTPAPD